MRTRLSELPEGTEVLPCPTRSRRRVSPEERLPGPIETRVERLRAQRQHVVGLKGDPDHLVQPVRLANGTVVRRDWRDPDDLSPNRRIARTVSGYAHHDEIKVLLDAGTITPALARTARRFRKEFELGEWGISGGRDLAREPGGYGPSAGPSETKLLNVMRWRATAKALRRHLLNLLVAIVVHDETIKDYAKRTNRGRREVAGEIVAALAFLKDYYKELDDGPQAVHEAAG